MKHNVEYERVCVSIIMFICTSVQCSFCMMY